jgi:hypothetical protein
MVLRPRPRKRCGHLDALWLQYEESSCGALGPSELCAACPRLPQCPWPGQYGIALRGARLILATQQRLALNPSFLLHLRRQTGASSSLLLLDESNLLIQPTERTIRAADLDHFIAAQSSLLAGPGESSVAGGGAVWLETTRLLAQATTPDLQEGQWAWPWVDNARASEIQERGRELFGHEFRFLGYELHHFAYSDPCSRERLPDGGIRFAAIPHLGDQFIIFSGSMARELARYRLDPSHAHAALMSPFEHYRFGHAGTRWFNLPLLAGASKYFAKNADRLLDFMPPSSSGTLRPASAHS